MVLAGTPLHGPNQWPTRPTRLRSVVLQYMAAIVELAQCIMQGIAMALQLPPDYFVQQRIMHDPTVLFRIFNYPEDKLVNTSTEERWGVGKHTDYGVLTILKQDDSGGLQVESRYSGWVEAPPIPNTFVCNIGDMLDRMTQGRFKSTPHRVKNKAPHNRLSFPLFFDPSWDAHITPLQLGHLPPVPVDLQHKRWDGEDVHAWQGPYGNYLLKKVGKVFPDLKNQHLKPQGYP